MGERSQNSWYSGQDRNNQRIGARTSSLLFALKWQIEWRWLPLYSFILGDCSTPDDAQCGRYGLSPSSPFCDQTKAYAMSNGKRIRDVCLRVCGICKGNQLAY